MVMTMLNQHIDKDMKVVVIVRDEESNADDSGSMVGDVRQQHFRRGRWS